jgi:cell division protein FtsB
LEVVKAYIKSIQQKTNILVKQHEQLQVQHKALQEQFAQTKTTSEQLKQQVAELQQQQLILKASLNTLDAVDKKQLEQQINTYIKNIDKCITLLSHKTNL